MPYDLTFTKLGTGSEAIAERLLPALRERYGDVRSDDAYIKLDDGDIALAIEILPRGANGVYCVTITSSTRYLAVLKRIEDVPQLEELKRIVAGEIAEWTGRLPDVTAVE